MKTLYMVRHAKSSWDDMSLSDHDRPLNGRGKRNAPEMGKRLKERGVNPDLLISSSANRAHSTAKMISTEIDYSKSDIELTRELYHADEEDIISFVQKQNDEINSLMIFGHNPGFTDCVNLLTGEGYYNIPTCGIAAITFDTNSWKGIDRGKGSLEFYDYPKKPWPS